ncbi:hypothetical protein [Actinomadura madurae]|uniref:hypothetical protein n=1 Tax=Actinomadura madurae TaxID=1993 RepID=UPI0020D23531|nr:hypothetical protein [Actinomadura madurae]MCQ0016069.1 hypothetical protein [Actinomadura madurae]
MGPHRGRSRAAALPLAAALALTGGALSGCESPVPFYRPGEGGADDPAVGLGGPAPYTRALPDRPGGGRGGAVRPARRRGARRTGRAGASTPPPGPG